VKLGGKRLGLHRRQRQEVAFGHRDDRRVVGAIVGFGALRSDSENDHAQRREGNKGERHLDQEAAIVVATFGG
jgi:hypothetical protein